MWIRPTTNILFLLGAVCSAAVCCASEPIALRVAENFVDPVGFHDPSPAFSWNLPAVDDIQSQTAYRIVVTSGAAKTPLWDSGKVDSDQSAWVPYEGPPLESRQQVFWRVKFWDDQHRESDWSDKASIEMGLLSNSDWRADWIEVARDLPEPDKVTITKAEYGNRDGSEPKVADVAKNLTRAIGNGVTSIRVKPARMGGDPAPEMKKTLWVQYKVNGIKKKATISENDSFDPYPSLTAQPGYYLRRDFPAEPKVVKARLYASALGIYEFQINGNRVSDDLLSPGYTTYSKRVETLTYDVTSMIREGDNAIGALIGEGWYAGNLLLRKRETLLGLTPKLIGQLELTYADGRVETIATDKSWKGTDKGPIRAGGYYHGEDYDAAMEFGGWSNAGFDQSDWPEVKSSPVEASPLLVPKRLPRVRAMKQMPAVKLTQPEPGKYVFDFGQNLVGVPEMTLPMKAGEKVAIRFAEMLEQDGTLYTLNYRTARSQASYTAKADGEVQWTPALSFFGFRYVEISGLANGDQLSLDSVTANVIHTDFDSTGKFVSSHAKLNQLQSNIRWGQLSNFIDIPTDCPQRDERLGWTGDAQVFLPTSLFNYDVHSFWARWLQSVRDEQTADGEIPHTVPSTPFGYSSPGWADVVVTAPWEVYERTGDIRILRDNYDAMKKWVAVYERRSKDFIPDLVGWGDWLQPYTNSDRKGDTAQELIATAYFGRDARILQRAATALGKTAEAERFGKLHAAIRRAFTNRYFPEGDTHPGANTQTACLMGLGYDLIEPDDRQRVESLLLKHFEEADRHLRTGFLGTPLLAPVFDELGHADICYELLFKESYPSWFYSINQGATTMWERWNSYSHADGFGDASMNSFNHYAYGAIGQFMYERVAGLTPDPKHPGYKHFFVRPLVGGPLDSASSQHNTPYGIAKSSWRRTDKGTFIDAIVPPNATATVILPTDSVQAVVFNGNPLADQDLTVKAGDQVSVEVGAGSHRFQILADGETAVDETKANVLVPPSGGQDVIAFGPDQKITFEVQNVKADAKWTSAKNMPFADVYQVETDTQFSDPKNIRVRMPIVNAIDERDVVLVSFWMRRPGSSGQPNNAILFVDATPESPGYQYRLSADQGWQQHVRTFAAGRDFDVSQSELRIELGEAGTVVEIAGLRIINYGEDFDIDQLPRSTVMYRGREKDAEWRQAALDRIEKIRKGNLTISVVDANGQPVSGANVAVAMQKHAFGFGNTVNSEMLGADQDEFPLNPRKKTIASWEDAKRYREIVQTYFDRATFESELRPHYWQRLQGDAPGWKRKKSVFLTKTVPWLRKNNITTRGHYIGWAPMDFNAFERQFVGDPQRHRAWLWKHMADVLPATNDFVTEWDTINHIVGWGDHTYENEYGGPEIYADIMAEARRLAPNATHAINEGKILPEGYKREPYKEIIRYLNSKGQAPDVVGFMGHFGMSSLTPPEELLQVYDEFAEIAPRLQLSEFDIDVGDDEQLQADYFRDVMIASFSHPKFVAIVQWGFWEKMHWKPAAALWRGDWTIKPAGQVFADLVTKQWLTDQTVITDSNGNAQLRGFLGDYKITADLNGKSAAVSATLDRAGKTVRIQLP